MVGGTLSDLFWVQVSYHSDHQKLNFMTLKRFLSLLSGNHLKLGLAIMLLPWVVALLILVVL